MATRLDYFTQRAQIANDGRLEQRLQLADGVAAAFQAQDEDGRPLDPVLDAIRTGSATTPEIKDRVKAILAKYFTHCGDLCGV